MKTTAQKLMIAATIALFSLTMNAQNTKSMGQSKFSGHLTGFVSGKVNHIAHELAVQIENIKATVKYFPSAINEAYFPSEPSFDYAVLTTEMEKDLKYVPTEMNLNYESYEEPSFTNLLQELETVVKYYPSDANSSEVVDPELNSLLAELSTDVKYKPASTR